MAPAESPQNPGVGLLDSLGQTKVKPFEPLKQKNLAISCTCQQTIVFLGKLHLDYGQMLTAFQFAGWDARLLGHFSCLIGVILNDLPYNDVGICLLFGLTGTGCAISFM